MHLDFIMTSEAGKTLRWLFVLLFFSSIIFYGITKLERIFSKASQSTTQVLAQALSQITGGQTKIVMGKAEITDKSQISELALLEMKMNAVRELESSEVLLRYLPLGTKRVIVKGIYKVKAGYRLKPGISLRKENDEVIANFPKPEILSVELDEFTELENTDGWANKVTGEDRSWLLSDLKKQMELEAKESGILTIIDSQLLNRLKDLLGTPHVRIENNDKNSL
jgi:Protein of unknown function (DUF4230)